VVWRLFEVRMAPDGQGRDCAAAEAHCRVYAFKIGQDGKAETVGSCGGGVILDVAHAMPRPD
jgi:hypothetical protein